MLRVGNRNWKHCWKIQKGSAMNAGTFKYPSQWPNEGPDQLAPGVWTSTSSARLMCSSFPIVCRGGWGHRSAKATSDDPWKFLRWRVKGTAKEGLEDSEVSRREQAWWAMAHVLEDLVREQVLLRESAERQEELLEDLVSIPRSSRMRWTVHAGRNVS